MKWVYPEFLFSLAVILIPLLIHLFHFKRYKTVYFSSLTFLKSIELEQKSTRKLKRWLLFALRTTAFVFFVFAFAQPYIPLKNSQAKNGIAVVAVYVDNSFSMSRIGTTGELVSQAKELAKSVIEDAPRNAQFVLITNDLSGDEKQTLTKSEFIEKINQVHESPLIRSAEDILKWWQQWEKDNERNGQEINSSQLIYLSDFQKQTIGKIKALSNWKSLIYPIQLEPVSTANLFVDSIWFDSPIHKYGSKQTLFARVKNDGDLDLSTVDVSVKIGNLSRNVFATLPAFGVDTVSVDFFNTQLGNLQGSVTIDDKQMMQDDAYYFTLNIKSNADVLVIEGEDASKNVGVVFSLDNYYKTSSINQQQVNFNTLKNKDLILLNGINNLSSSSSNALIACVKDGTTLLMIPGTNVAAVGWNNLLNELHMPLVSVPQENGLIVKSINTKDPFFDGVFEQKPSQLNVPLVKKAYRLQKTAQTQSIDLLSFQNGSSFVLKGTGKYPCYFIATSLDSEWSSFTSNQLFSTILLRVAGLSQRNTPYFQVIGESALLPIDGVQSSEHAIHLVSNECNFIPKLLTKQSQSFLSTQGLEAIRLLKAGNFSIQLNKQEIGKCSFNSNRNESEVKALTSIEINQLFEEAGIKTQTVKSAKRWTGANFLQLNQPITYWKWCVLFALFFLLGEMMVVLFYKSN